MTGGNDDRGDPFRTLLEKAERLLQSNRGRAADLSGPQSQDGILDLIHELQVHQAEMELQNEELMNTNEEYRVLEEEYRHLFESAPFGYLILNPEGKVTQCNARAGELLDIESVRLVGKTLDSYFLSESVLSYRTSLADAGGQHAHQDLELPLRTTDSAERWLQVYIVTDYDTHGIVTQWRVILTDVTRRRKAEEESIESEERIRQLVGHLQQTQEKQLSYFAREIHDSLSQTLVAVKMNLVSALRRAADPEVDIKPILGEAIKLSSVAISTAKNLNIELHPALLDEFGLSDAIQWKVEQYAEQTGLAISITIHNGIPPIPEGESTAMYQISLELLSNAMLHAQAEHIDVVLEYVNEVLTLEVRDDGIGIQDDDIKNPRSFGVAGVCERARYLGGHADFAGQTDAGTVVRVHIPIVSLPKDDTS
jgi:PAS domain S-box-containing protein